MADTEHLTVREISEKLRDHLSKVTPEELAKGLEEVHAGYSQPEHRQNGKSKTSASSNGRSRETHGSRRP